jgi:type IV pilus assembly protein PilA
MNRSRIRKNRRAFTLVELLVVVLILAILMAVALPLYLGAIASSERGAARANMQTIANANQSYRLKNSTYSATIALLEPDLGSAAIRGPGDRTYTITLNSTNAPGNPCDHDGNDTTAAENVPAGSFSVQSTVGTDGCFIPGVSTK